MAKIRLRSLLALVGLAVAIAGCSGSGNFATAKASGKVVCNGQPIQDAVVTFTPQAAPGATMPGKSASGRTDATGNFVLSTYQPNDGAVVGKHTVTVGLEDPNKTLPGKVPDDLVLEVKPGGNDFTIELKP